MGWETRTRGGPYYTRSRRVNGEVRREYVGGGTLGKIAALDDQYERRRRQEEAAYWNEKEERLEQDASFLREFEEAAKILVRAHLIAAGCHRHKGEWRRVRESA